jgi:hypothetical protein
MPRAGRRPRRAPSQADYRDWKNRAAAELERVHGIKASAGPRFALADLTAGPEDASF